MASGGDEASRGTSLITGGTGKVGRRIVRGLLARGQRVRVASRSGEAPEGGSSVRFDWSAPGGHDAALEGVGRIFLVAPALGSDPFPLMAAFIERALQAGVRRFVLLSASSLPEGGFAMGRVHELLHARAPEWAVLRPSWFMQNFTEGPRLDALRNEGVLYSATGEGRVPFIDAGDIAEVGLRALLDERSHDTDHVLTGPQALSYAEAARMIGAALGRPIRHVNLSAQAFTEQWVSYGRDPTHAALLAGMDEAIGQGVEDRTTPVVEQVTGRPARSFSEFAQASVSAWR